MATTNIFNNIVSIINNSTKNPENFLSVQENIAFNLKDSTKNLYDFTRKQSCRKSHALPELVTEGFDEEQIWQQLELQNEAELPYFVVAVSKILAKKQKLIMPFAIQKPEPEYNKSDASVNSDEPRLDIVPSEDDSSHEDSALDLEDEREPNRAFVKRRRIKSSIVDDKFFKLQELDEYLTNVEQQEKEGEKGSDQSDDESVDLFNDESDNDSDHSEQGKFPKYADFFDNPESETEPMDHIKPDDSADLNKSDMQDSTADCSDNFMDDEEDSRPSKKVKFNLANDSDETDSLENKAERLVKEQQAKSSLELRQERLQERITNLEEQALSKKPWQLKGEVGAADRPQNSLLEEFVEFDVTSRPAPIITEQTTLKLEDIIKQRIKDKAWDDVEKKFKPVETPLEYKKKLVLDQEKSKESLAQIYENEYLKQKKALKPDSGEQEEEEPEPELLKDIRRTMQSLFSKLDALSNFHYTPKPAIAELKIVSNVPAISMEEVAPVAVSDAALLAPEEIKNKLPGDLIGKSEQTRTDMNRKRRQKKLRQREKGKAIAKKEKLNALTGFAKKKGNEKDAALIKKLTHARNITKLDESNYNAPSSSTAFFDKLQDQVKSHIKSRTANTAQKQNAEPMSAKKFKL